jgi:hypothetical protein
MKKSIQKRSGISAVWKGSLTALVLTAVFCALGAAFVHAGILPQSSVRVCGAASVFLSVFVGCLATTGRTDRRLIVMAIICAGYAFAVLLCRLAFVPGDFHNGLWTLVPVLSALLAAAPAANRRRLRRRR